jgi:hypothetical protein
MSMVRELEGTKRPRPARIAFLVEDGAHAHLVLDGIFADSYRRWGGRFSLIVPCTDGKITDSYWAWLEAYDPDIVYSYVEFSDLRILEIHERISPALYTEHKLGTSPRLTLQGFKPTYGFDILSSLSTIFRLARHRASREVASATIIDAWHTETPSRFLTDNFGTYQSSFGTSLYPPDARNAASLVTIVSPEKQADRRFAVPQDLNIIPAEEDALRAFAERRASSLSIVSALFAPKLEVRSGGLGGSFNLVVGNSYADRILFWNARHFIPAWLDNDISCLRVEMTQLQDDNFLELLKELLNRRNFVNDGSGGQPQLTLRSLSHTSEDLEVARQRLSSVRLWSGAGVAPLTNLDDIVPRANELSNATESNQFAAGSLSRSDRARFGWVPPVAKISPLVPDHLSDAPPRQSFTIGSWCTDFVFECDAAPPRMASQNVWEIPKRWRMADAFKVTRAGSSTERMPSQRRSRGGLLSVFENTDYLVNSIAVPTPYEAIQHALALDGRWAAEDRKRGIIVPANKVLWTDPSNEARYFDGVIGMAGSVRRASQFLLHPFLRGVFAKLGGSPGISTNRVTPTVNSLAKQARTRRTFELSDERDKQALATLIVKAAGSLKTSRDHIRYADLKAEWAEHRRLFWEAQQHQPESNADVDWDAHEQQSLDECLIELRRCEILFQGHRWTCHHCHHKNWVDLAALRPELSCAVCRAKQYAPIDIDWLFRANTFLIESLRDHSVLSLLWLLEVLRNRARRSLIYVPPTWFGYESEKRSPDAEADLLLLIDGRAVISEVKSSWAGLRRSDITDFVALAKRLRPDIAILAVMEAGTGPAAEIASARAELADDGVAFELITAHGTGDDEPYLTFDEVEE